MKIKITLRTVEVKFCIIEAPSLEAAELFIESGESEDEDFIHDQYYNTETEAIQLTEGSEYPAAQFSVDEEGLNKKACKPMCVHCGCRLYSDGLDQNNERGCRIGGVHSL